MSLLSIFYAIIGYPILLILLDKTCNREYKLSNEMPTVTLLIVAHNEEKVILRKMENALSLDYPKDKFKIIVSSDNSSDKTNSIVEEFIKNNESSNIKLYKVLERKGKTNAQNEAVRLIDTELIVFTDANAILKEDAIKELVSYFGEESVAYVTGKLVYVNSYNDIGKSETFYWEKDLKMRSIESKIKTITAGNGAIYAVKTKDYVNFKPIKSHDSAMPLYYALKKRRAIYNEKAIAYEKTGDNVGDEFKRKVRMNRNILKSILPTVRILNIFKYGWFTIFYLGHRTLRYLLWFNHLVILVLNIVLLHAHIIFLMFLAFQILFYLLAIITHFTKIKNKYFNLTYYYTITIIAQWVGVLKILTGKAKPFWNKAESTRGGM